MSTLDPFWTSINAALDRIVSEKPDTFAGVKAILNELGNPDGTLKDDRAATFFAGSGGDRSLFGALYVAGWRRAWMEADYYYVARNVVTGETLTYVEGDVYEGMEQS